MRHPGAGDSPATAATSSAFLGKPPSHASDTCRKTIWKYLGAAPVPVDKVCFQEKRQIKWLRFIFR